jgi:hypothetical protein
MTRHAWAGITFILVAGALGLGREGFGGHHPVATGAIGLVVMLGLFVALKASRTSI